MKYIVYKTTNLINGKIYIGVHCTDDFLKFDGYIGNGISSNKSKFIINPKEPFQFSVKKYGYSNFKREVLFVFNTRQEALEKEKELVNEEFISREDTYNITIGGGAPPLLNIPVYQYDLCGNFVKEFNSQISAAKEIGCNGSCISLAISLKRKSHGFYWSNDKTDILDLSDYRNYSPNKQVYLYDAFKKYITSFESIAKCAKFLNASISNVQRSIRTGCKVRGYIASFKKADVIDISNKIISEQKHCKEYIQSIKKKVGQYNQAGELIYIFDSVREARKHFPNVSKVLNGQASHCHNFIFKYISQ